MEKTCADSSAAFERQVRKGCRKAARLAAHVTRGDVDTALRQVRTTWIETELPSRCAQTWQTIWDAVQAAGLTSPVMTADERRRHTALPGPVTHFRGRRLDLALSRPPPIYEGKTQQVRAPWQNIVEFALD